MWLQICRRFSTSLGTFTKNKAPLKGIPIDRNLPQDARVKPWEKANISKDVFFMRKYGNISPDERKRLDEKVERQRRARKVRKQQEAEERQLWSLKERPSRGDAKINPIYEYVFGTHAVLAALRGNRRPLFGKLFVHNVKNNEILSFAKTLGLKIVEKSSKGELNMLCNNGIHNGVVLETRPFNLPSLGTLGVSSNETSEYEVEIYDDETNTTIATTKDVARIDGNSVTSIPKHPLGIYLDSITDPQNMGAIVRSAYYLGADFIIVPDHQTARLGPVAAKASAGALDLIDVYKVELPLSFITSSKNNGWSIISTSVKSENEETLVNRRKHKKVQEDLNQKYIDVNSLSSVLENTPVLLVMGGEGEGVRTHMKIKSDFLVGLAKGRKDEFLIVDSLNVSVAAAILIEKLLAGSETS